MKVKMNTPKTLTGWGCAVSLGVAGLLSCTVLAASQATATPPAFNATASPDLQVIDGSNAANLQVIAEIRSHNYYPVWSPDGSLLALDDSNGIFIYEADTLNTIGRIDFHDFFYRQDYAFLPDGGSLAVGLDREIVIFDVQSGQELRRIPANHTLQRIAVSPDGQMIASAAVQELILWRLNEAAGQSLASFVNLDIYGLAFSPDGQWLALASDFYNNREVTVWNVASGQVLETLPTVTGGFAGTSVAFSPDGELMAWTAGRAVKVWDMVEEQMRFTVNDPEGSGGTSVAFSPDRKLLAVAFLSGSVSLLDVTDGQAVATIPVAANQHPLYIVFSPDGRILTLVLKLNKTDTVVQLWGAANQ